MVKLLTKEDIKRILQSRFENDECTRLNEIPKPSSLKDIGRASKRIADAKVIRERHRHRYEANPAYRESFEKAGLIVSGESDGLIEAVELKGHQWFLGVQFHPEFTSRLTNPNKTILGFAKAALTQRQNG